jgi:hypothetical protein
MTTAVLVQMRVCPLAWAYGEVIAHRSDGRVEVSMPYKNRHLFQVFESHQVIRVKEPKKPCVYYRRRRFSHTI